MLYYYFYQHPTVQDRNVEEKADPIVQNSNRFLCKKKRGGNKRTRGGGGQNRFKQCKKRHKRRLSSRLPLLAILVVLLPWMLLPLAWKS